MRARALRRADNRAQVVRVGNAVQHHQERGFAALLGQREHLLHRAVLVSRRERQHPLMVLGDRVQSGTVHLLHGYALFLGHGDDLTGRAAQIAARNQ